MKTGVGRMGARVSGHLRKWIVHDLSCADDLVVRGESEEDQV